MTETTPEPEITFEDVREAYMTWAASQKELHKRHGQLVLKHVLEAAKAGKRSVAVSLTGSEFLYLLQNGDALRSAMGPEFKVQITGSAPTTVSVSWELK